MIVFNTWMLVINSCMIFINSCMIVINICMIDTSVLAGCKYEMDVVKTNDCHKVMADNIITSINYVIYLKIRYSFISINSYLII